MLRFYSGDPKHEPNEALPVVERERESAAKGYRADPGLVDAVNVALLLGQPLLLTGEAGTGKTQLAFSLAEQLKLGAPLKYETKSTTVASDLFYRYDALARFHAAHSGGASATGAFALQPARNRVFRATQSGGASGSALDYIKFNALGEAIILTNPHEAVRDLVPKSWEYKGPRRSVVLIDEVDKAPRDLPNDILNELEGLYFRIPEMEGRRVGADQKLRPIVVFTSNSEKNLPDAFLRRCVYYNIPFPNPEDLQTIVLSRLGEEFERNEFLATALGLFFELRNPIAGLRKRPATAELLGWLVALRQLFPKEPNPLFGKDRDRVLGCLSALVKTPEDQESARERSKSWLDNKLKEPKKPQP
jgi:MoxR-like ATPase